MLTVRSHKLYKVCLVQKIIESGLEVVLCRCFLCRCIMMMVVMMMLRTWTALWTWATLATLWTRTTLTTLWTWAALTWRTLYVVCRLLNEYTVRELELASLRVNIDEFDFDFVAFLETCFFNCLKTLPLDFRDMEETFLTWEELNEASVRHD